MDEQTLQKALGIVESEMTRGIEYKSCFYHSCTAKPIKAHSIQNNKILNRISHNGMVACPKPSVDSEDVVIDVVPVGRGIASTFFGFCNYHDTEIFKPIENTDYTIGNGEQEFLFAYRALAKEYSTKHKTRGLYERVANLSQDEFNEIRIKAGLTDGFSPDMLNTFGKISLRGTDESLVILERYRKMMNTNLDRGRFWKIETNTVVLPKFYPVAVSSFTFIEKDLNGNVINDLEIYKDMKPLFLSIFPQGEETFALFGYFARHKDSYAFIDKQILNADLATKKVILSNIIAQYVENAFFSSAFWNRIPVAEQKKFNIIFRDTMLGKGSLVIDANMNLFSD